MRAIYCLLLGAACLALLTDAKTVFLRRADKISENFKQLDLPPEEIDPNVAPPEPQKVETIDPEDVISTELASAVSSNELVVDESINEIPIAETHAVVAPPAAAAAPPAASAAAASPATSVVAVAATTAAPKPTAVKPDLDKNPINRYCKCSESHCDCCRKFGLPLLPSGPGCAKISYLGNDEMSVSIKYGDITLASRRISAKKARPICVGLPGGYSKFCGRVYNLSRAKENFKACLAFELRAEDEVEAALRVSCFKFGPEGLRVADAEPLPTEVNKEEDDDDDDIFGFAAGGGDDDEDEDDYDADDADDAEEPDDDDADDYTEDDDAEAPEDADYGGFSLGGLLDELDDDDEETASKKPAVAITALAPADQTREHMEPAEQLAQSKDEAGTAAVVAASDAIVAAAAAVETEAESSGAAVEEEAVVEATTVKSKKAKKAKKNKKKKAAASAGEEGFAYELLNGILDFFN